MIDYSLTFLIIIVNFIHCIYLILGQYRKIDLAKTMAANMNGLQINCPKTVERSFFLSLITNRKIMN